MEIKMTDDEFRRIQEYMRELELKIEALAIEKHDLKKRVAALEKKQNDDIDVFFRENKKNMENINKLESNFQKHDQDNCELCEANNAQIVVQMTQIEELESKLSDFIDIPLPVCDDDVVNWLVKVVRLILEDNKKLESKLRDPNLYEVKNRVDGLIIKYNEKIKELEDRLNSIQFPIGSGCFNYLDHTNIDDQRPFYFVCDNPDNFKGACIAEKCPKTEEQRKNVSIREALEIMNDQPEENPPTDEHKIYGGVFIEEEQSEPTFTQRTSKWLTKNEPDEWLRAFFKTFWGIVNRDKYVMVSDEDIGKAIKKFYLEYKDKIEAFLGSGVEGCKPNINDPYDVERNKKLGKKMFDSGSGTQPRKEDD
jgi:hypothetical protein